ncbi:cytochrome P450 4c3-like [Uloborus diversus]|uniref:cytochrome P450 4c3-like n=1 Tax=Uloborus diversus TaxID=327109 RepID=UPI0024097E0D|nr:cytochrome P450 4c3-like [Uloborus diversus]
MCSVGGPDKTVYRNETIPQFSYVIEDKRSNAKRSLDVEHLKDSDYRKSKKAFLELMVLYHLKNPSFTIEDIEDEVNTIMAGGHDTTAGTMKWIVYLLGLHPDVQDKVFDEQRSLFQDNPHRPLTYEDTCKMKYTECVIKETLRLFPPLPVFGRIAQKDIVIGNQIIPKDSFVAFNVYSLHRNPKVFPEPEKYIPERFLPENSSGRHPYAFLPFSAGPRNCVGQKFAMLSMKVQLSHLLRSFKVTSLDHRDQVNIMWKLTLDNVKPIRVKFTPR